MIEMESCVFGYGCPIVEADVKSLTEGNNKRKELSDREISQRPLHSLGIASPDQNPFVPCLSISNVLVLTNDSSAISKQR